MTEPKIGRTMLIAGVVSCALLQPACKTQDQPSALIGGYTFSRDFDGERRVLRIEPSSAQPAECMLTDLPAGDEAPWKEATLDPASHRALIDLLFDDARFPQYKSDTAASVLTETYVCASRAGEPEFCYVPQVVVAGVSSPWRFGLQSELTLSEQGQELIDEFLSAHEVCWNGGTAMDGGL
jgi:hypothetical protein